jgi:hypothetical protein
MRNLYEERGDSDGHESSCAFNVAKVVPVRKRDSSSLTHHALTMLITYRTTVLLKTFVDDTLLDGRPRGWSILLVLAVHCGVVSPLEWRRGCHFGLSNIQSCGWGIQMSRGVVSLSSVAMERCAALTAHASALPPVVTAASRDACS